MLFFILQYRSNFHSILAKIQVLKQVKSHYFLPFTSFVLSVFRNKTCILHHFAFLDGRQLTIFSLPNTRFWPLKNHFQPLNTHFLMAILPLLPMFLMPLKGFIYTNAADIYAFCLAFNGKKHCIQHHFTLCLAPKCTAFSIKTHCIQHQNALYLAAYCTAFCCKQPKSWCK